MFSFYASQLILVIFSNKTIYTDRYKLLQKMIKENIGFQWQHAHKNYNMDNSEQQPKESDWILKK